MHSTGRGYVEQALRTNDELFFLYLLTQEVMLAIGLT